MVFINLKIPSIHVDPLEEPVVDIAAGGYELPYQSEGFTSVWIVTINGRVNIYHRLNNSLKLRYVLLHLFQLQIK